MNENTSGSFIDFYETLQISPKADGETIHRVYRLLALRYHPDNRETGDQSTFEAVLKAYRVLNYTSVESSAPMVVTDTWPVMVWRQARQ